ncbi:MAG: glycosyltransferase [Phycisphaerae bacterium]|nr:glycosyltransferase [Phycisphaerae bacterium]
MHTVLPTGSKRTPPTLLHLVSTFQIKTDTKWLVQVARYLDRGSFRLSAACFYTGGPVRDQLEAMGVRTYNLNVRDERDPRAIVRARRLIAEIGCEIVHTHLLRADLFGGAAARWAEVPIIVSTAYAMGQYRRQRRRRCDRLLDAMCSRLPTHAIAVSQAVKDDCVDRLDMAPDRVTVIHTGVDPPEAIDPDRVAALRCEWGVGPEVPLVVTVARLSYEKGLDTLIDAAEVLRETHPLVRVVVVGEGPDRVDLEARIRDRGLTGMMLLAGFYPDVWPVYAAADVLCLPSKSEGMPNVLLEAMAIGRPVVATAVGGVPEAVVAEENGLLVEPENARQLAAAIARLVDDGATALRLGAAAKRTIEGRFLARDVVARYSDFYRRLLAQRGRGRVCVTAATS